MHPLRVLAFLAYLAAFLAAFGWLIHTSLGHVVGIVALGLLLEVLAAAPRVPVSG